MRQRLAIIITLIIVVIVLIALNAASYVRVEHVSDSEATPDRSTFNSGATGTQALYDFLRESHYQVARWREPSSSLLSFSGPKPSTFVIIGPTRVPYTKRESREVLRWVASGGRLVLIDRTPERNLLSNLKDWKLTSEATNYPWHDLDPNDFDQMTAGVKAIRPAQPTVYARNVESVMPSRFSGRITVAANENATDTKAHGNAADDDSDDSEEWEEAADEAPVEEGPQ